MCNVYNYVMMWLNSRPLISPVHSQAYLTLAIFTTKRAKYGLAENDLAWQACCSLLMHHSGKIIPNSTHYEWFLAWCGNSSGKGIPMWFCWRKFMQLCKYGQLNPNRIERKKLVVSTFLINLGNEIIDWTSSPTSSSNRIYFPVFLVVSNLFFKSLISDFPIWV